MSERDDLRAMVRELLTDRSGSEQVRAALERPEGHDPELWRTVVDLGLSGLLVPEEHGGAGAEFADMAVVLHELGRRVVPLPILSGGVLAATALAGCGNAAVAAELLPAIAAGERSVAVAVGGPEGQLPVGTWTLRWSADGDGIRLDGVTGYVLDAPDSDVVIVAANGPDGPVLAAVDSSDARIERVPTTDRTRRLGTVSLGSVAVPRERLLAEPEDAVSGTDTGPGQLVGQPVDALVEFAVRGALVVADRGDLVGVRPRVLVGDVPEGQSVHSPSLSS